MCLMFAFLMHHDGGPVDIRVRLDFGQFTVWTVALWGCGCHEEDF